MTLRDAAYNAMIELRNIHREYLAGQHGGCPCSTGSGQLCPTLRAIEDVELALDET